MSDFKRTTTVFPIRGSEVLLGMKKRGHGAGWWNGFGGKLNKGETFEESARRETLEEVGLEIASLRPVARLLFYFNGSLGYANLAFIAEGFTGEPVETEEMRPKWFDISFVPYREMWPGDNLWVPYALRHNEGKPPSDSALYFKGNNQFVRISEADPDVLAEAFDL